MKNQKTGVLSKLLSLLLNLAVVRMELWAIPMSWDGVHEQMFTFYTENSNLFAMAVCALMALCQLWVLIFGREIPRWIKTLKYMVTCCLMLTFLTVVFVLAPIYGPGGHYIMLCTSSMLYNHLLNPVVTFVSFVFFERRPALEKRAVFYPLIPTLIYGLPVLALNILGVMEGPYPFLRVYQQPLWASCAWAVAIIGGNLLIARALWALGGNKQHSFARR